MCFTVIVVECYLYFLLIAENACVVNFNHNMSVMIAADGRSIFLRILGPLFLHLMQKLHNEM